MKEVLACGFERLQLQRIIAIAGPENKGSLRVLEKVGFTFEKATTCRGHEVAGYGLER